MSRAGKPNVKSRTIVDDFGDARLYRRCACCHSWRPQAIGQFSPRQRDKQTRRVIRWDSYCRDCRSASQRKVWARKSQEERTAHARRRWEQVKSDPVLLEERREQHRRAARDTRRRDPEAARARVRAYYERVKADPAKYARYLETQRIAYRLRAERGRGVHVADLRSVDLGLDERMGVLPVTPLVAAIEGWLGGRDIEEAGAFLDSRTFRAWREGVYTTTQFDVADRVLIGIDLLWWEVWIDEGHERACELFTGEKVAA